MKPFAKATFWFTVMIIMTFSKASAQLPTYADEYLDDRAGYGLTGHFINDDNLLDLVTTYNDAEVGGVTWLNNAQNPGSFGDWQNIIGGREAKFGILTSQDDHWRLVVAAGNYIAHYRVIADQQSQLDQEQTIYNYDIPADFVCWGHINGDEYGDVVATDAGSANGVLVYLGYESIYQGNIRYLLNPTWNPNPFNPSCNLNQLALVRMHDWAGEWGWKWDLLAVDGGSTNNLKLFANNGGTGSNAGFDTKPVQTLDAGDPIRDFTLGRLDNGQYLDLVLCTNDGGDHYVKTYLNDEDEGFGPDYNQSHSFNGVIDQVALGDYNHDYHEDLAVYWNHGRVDLFLNDGDGNFNFNSPSATCYIPDYGTDAVEANELMFMQLGSNGLYSLAMTGIENETDPGMWIWFNNGPTPYVHPVPAVNFDGVPNGHPTIQWIECETWTVDKYVIYRALMPDASRPTENDFDSLTYVERTTKEFTDTTVTIHTENDNYKIWYTVTAMDAAGHESIKHDFVTFWDYYEDGGGYRFYGSVNYGQHAEFAVQVAPNPFNPIVTFTFELRQACPVELAIYDLSGRLVATLIDGWRDAGSYNLSWDASDLPSGVYLYRLAASEIVAAGKIVLMK